MLFMDCVIVPRRSRGVNNALPSRPAVKAPADVVLPGI